jgi:long-chain fatty acid transport protein
MQEFDSYKGLFAEQGGFDLPSSFQLGVAYKLTPANQVVFDWQKNKLQRSKKYCKSNQ